MNSISMAIDPVVVWSIRLAGAVLFFSAAVHKLRNPAEFRGALAGYGIVPSDSIPAVALGLPALEYLVAAGLVVPAWARVGAIAGIALLTTYAAAIAFNLSRGRTAIDCGCGGPGGSRPIGSALVVRNVLLIGLLAVSLFPAATRPLGWLDVATVLCGVLASALLYAAIDVAIANAARLRGAGGLRWSTR